MKPLLQFSSLRVGHSSGLAVLDPFDTLLDRRTTPRAAPAPINDTISVVVDVEKLDWRLHSHDDQASGS